MSKFPYSFPSKNLSNNDPLNSARSIGAVSFTTSVTNDLSRCTNINKIEDCLEQIESSLKSLDSSFAFEWDNEVSLQFAAKCVKQVCSKLLELKEQICENAEIETGSIILMKLKNLESKLISREKLVKDQEESLAKEKTGLEAKFKELEQEQSKLRQEKAFLEESWSKLNQENAEISAKMIVIDQKYEQIMQAVSSYNAKPFLDTQLISTEDSLGKEKELQKEKEKLLQEKKLFEKLKSDFAQSQSSHEEERKSFLRLRREFQIISEKSLMVQRDLVKTPSDLLEAQLNEVYNLKQSLMLSQELCLSEQKRLKEEYNEKVAELLVSHKNLKEKFNELSDKEIALEIFSNHLEKEKIEISEIQKTVKNSEEVKERLEKLQMTWEDLQSEYSEMVKFLEIKQRIIEVQERSIFAVKNDDKSELLEIYQEVKVKLNEVLKEESEVLAIQKHVFKEKRENEVTAELLKTIHDELNKHQTFLETEHEKLKEERREMERIFFKLENQARSVEEKEAEILDSMKNINKIL